MIDPQAQARRAAHAHAGLLRRQRHARFVHHEPVGGALLGLESAQGRTGGKQTYFWVLFPSLLASAVA